MKILQNSTIKRWQKHKNYFGLYLPRKNCYTKNRGGKDVIMTLFITDKIRPVIDQQTIALGNKLKGYPMYNGK